MACAASRNTHRKRWQILIGISQSYISRLEKRIIRHLRMELEETT